MNINEIPILPVSPGLSDGLKAERQKAPEYLRRLIEEMHGIEGLSSIKELNKGDIQALKGGNMSVDYSIRTDGRWVVVKFRTQGAEAEAEVLRAWAKVGADVVKVYNNGVIPGVEIINRTPLKFLVLEAATNDQGQLAKTAGNYLKEHPEAARPIGVKMGEDLAIMHRAKTDTHFGEFADMWGASGDDKYQTWNSYLLGYVDMHYQELKSLGFSDQTLEKLKKTVQQMQFSKEGVYLHGDYSRRNVLLVSKEPYRVKAFDPNPIIGQPSWDLAIIQDNVTFARKRYEHEPENEELEKTYREEKAIRDGLMQGYRQAGGREVSELEIRVAGLMQTMYLLQGKEKRARKEGKNPEEFLDYIVVKETMQEEMEAVVGGRD